MKFSVVIPYKQRLGNITAAFASLVDQTMPGTEFEVIVGVMEYDRAYTAACADFCDRLNIRSVLSADEWNVSQARNLALRQATGQVVLFLDADMIMPPQLLDSLYDRYYSAGQNVCVLGQAIGYSGKYDVLEVQAQPYDHYRDLLAEMVATGDIDQDVRWSVQPLPLPWAVCWTGLVALPAETIRRHDLTFDEGFRGWGGEDQEWGYRIHATGTPIVLGQDVHAMHLPHSRDVAANFARHLENKRYFLAKWPSFEIELYLAFTWEEANRTYARARRDFAALSIEPGDRLGVLHGRSGGADLVIVGAILDADQQLVERELYRHFDEDAGLEILPLTGLALPYADGSIDECRLTPRMYGLDERYRAVILAEAARVATSVGPLSDRFERSVS